MKSCLVAARAIVIGVHFVWQCACLTVATASALDGDVVATSEMEKTSNSVR